MFAMLKHLVDELTKLEKRADKYRGREGRISISADEYRRLVAMAGADHEHESGELTFAEYVGLVDAAIAAVCVRLNVSEAIDELISGEI